MSPLEIPVSPSLDLVLRKFGKIWVWSILSTAIGAFSIRSVSSLFQMVSWVTNPTFVGQQNEFALYATFAISLIGPVATLISVYYLLQFLRYHVIPILFPPATPVHDESIADTEFPPAAVIPDGGVILFRAFAATLFAVGMEVLVSLIALAIRAASSSR